MEPETRPYTGPGDKTLPDNVKALPDHAKAIWVAAFNSAFKGWDSSNTDLTQEGYAMAVAWGAVKKQYKKDAEGNWTKRSAEFEGAGYLTKVWRAADGARHWRATVMDDGVDQYATRMTIEFQDDVCARAAGGPMPWLGVAHFGKESQIGETTRLYRDGRQVKAEGTFLAAPATALQRELIEAAWDSASKEAALLPAHRAIRTSQAFYPEAHIVEDCGVLGYTRGRMDHIALTVRPGNSRADFGVEEDDMRTSKSRRRLRREDAAAIVGEDLAARLDAANRKTAGLRSVEDDGLVYRMAEDDEIVEVSVDGETWEDFADYLARATTPFANLPIGDRKAPYREAEVLPRVRKWASSDGSGDKEKMDWPKFQRAFFWRDPDMSEDFGGYKLKFGDVVDGTLTAMPRGVFLAGAVMQGARGGVDIPDADRGGVKNHIARYYSKMAKQFDDEGIVPPWEQGRSSLWLRAGELWALEEAGEADALAAAQESLRADLAAGDIEKPVTAIAAAVFDQYTDFGAAVLRATGVGDFAGAIRAIVSDPDQVGVEPDPEDRAGRRVKGEMLAKVKEAMRQFKAASAAITDFVGWAGENLPEEPDRAAPPAHRDVAPAAEYAGELTERMNGVEPDDSVIAAMNEHALVETAYTAAYTFVDIVVANVKAQADELTQEQRLQNVQRALNEFGQIIASIIAQSAPATGRSGGDGSSGAATDTGVKPGGQGGAPASPPDGGPVAEAQAAVTESLTDIAGAVARGANAGEMQVLLDGLAVQLQRCVAPPPVPGIAEAMAPVWERLQAIEDHLRAGAEPEQPASGAAGPPAAPPRRKGFLPRLDTPNLETRRLERPSEQGWSPRQFVEGAHRRQGGFNPYA